MKASNYRVKLNLTPLDFPAINGLSKHTDFTQTETPIILNNKVVLKITRKFILIETYTNKEHEVFSAQSIYEIPMKEINTREDIYAFYLDATSNLNDAYQYAQKQIQLPDLSFPTQPIENFQKEIDGVFYLLSIRN